MCRNARPAAVPPGRRRITMLQSLHRSSVHRFILKGSAAAAALALSAPQPLAWPYRQTLEVPTANPRVTGAAPCHRLAARMLGRDIANVAAASGAMPVENPSPTANGLLVSHYGYLNDGPQLPALGSNLEAQKTEPDKNTFLVLPGQHGADAAYDYGSHFLYQGHESGISSGGFRRGSITRINLDADDDHRVTVLATTDEFGNFLPVFDGSTWDPFAQVLLFTAELGNQGGVWQATPDLPSIVTDVSGALGRGGYEGIQADSAGSLWIVEDVGGSTGAVNNRARQPNSFLYRFVPKDVHSLELGGRLEGLQVISNGSGQPIVFHAGQADADILSQDVRDLHTFGLTFDTNWITLHDTSVDGFAPFDANALAKARGATPFKRPENGVFRPGTQFLEFVLTETGDTSALTQAGSAFGGFGALFRLVQSGPSASTGKLTLFYLGDVTHTGLDNLSFLTRDLLLVGEDAGDTLHGQRNALDSLYQFDLAHPDASPLRVLAEGRDHSATVDAGLAGTPGFQNDGDNEITGIHVSDGDPSINGLFGTRDPRPFLGGGARIFWTQQP